MMKFDSAKAVEQCLADAGCDTQTISAFLSCMKRSDLRGALALLEGRRAQLLDHIHQVRSRIAMLDDQFYKLRDPFREIRQGERLHCLRPVRRRMPPASSDRRATQGGIRPF